MSKELRVVEDLRELDLFAPLTGGPGLVRAICSEFLQHWEDPWLPLSGWVKALVVSGMTESAARTALRRAVAAGGLVRESRGTEPGCAMSPARLHVWRAAPEPDQEDQRWLLVILSISEARRDLRSQMRRLLVRGNFGSLGNGVWLGRPHSASFALQYAEVLGVAPYVDMFVSDSVGPHDPSTLVARCWDLEAVAQGYRASRDLARAALKAKGTDGEAAFGRVMAVSQATLAAWYVDPLVPFSLLPPDWPAQANADAVEAVMARDREPAHRWLASLS